MKPVHANRFLFLFLATLFLQASCQSSTQTTKAPLQTNQSPSPTDSLPKSVGYVNDFENLYTIEEQKHLDELITEFEDATTVQMALVSIPAYFIKNGNIDDYTLQLGRTWGVGRKDKNNGILIGISSELRHMRIQNGTGIETILSNAETKRIVDSFFIPEFKKGNYYAGTLKGIQEVMKTLKEKLK